jgi:hypothetical protein
LSPSILWTNLTIPIGAWAGASAAYFTGKPAASAVASFSIGYWAYSMLFFAFFGEIVVDPRLPIFKKDPETRWRWMGFLLVLGGVLAQLIAAIMDITGE